MISHDEIAKLTASERMSLIAELWDSIDDVDIPLPKAQHEELLHRLESFEEDQEQAVSWEALKAELNARER